MKKLPVSALALLLFASAAFANVDTVMIVTDIAAVDSSVAGAAASKAGIPVLVSDRGMLNAEIRATLAELAPDDVILIGGPVVIKTDVEAELTGLGYNVIRLWGIERTGTAVAVANHFWPEGASCAVLVADTKNDDRDAKRHRKASNLAANLNCTLVPIPEGTLPAEVISMITELNVQQVIFVGRNPFPELRVKIKNKIIREIIGTDDEIEDDIDDEIVNNTNRTGRKAKLVIVAVPDWREGVAASSHRHDRSVVRFVTDVSQVPEIIVFINANAITDVRVVGTPPLASDVAAQLNASGVAVTHISGQRAHEIAKEIVKEFKEDWEERRDEAKNILDKMKARIKEHVDDLIAKLDERLASAQAEVDSLPDGADKTALQSRLDNAKAKLEQAKALVAEEKYEGALRLLSDAWNTYYKERFERRHNIGIDIEEELEDEEESLEESNQETGARLARAERLAADVRARCSNPEVVDAVITKAKTLRERMQAAHDAGNFTGAAEHREAVKELVKIAQRIAEACKERGRIAETSVVSVEKRGVMIDRSGPNEGEELPKEATIEITSSGFSPGSVRIAKGGTVTWINRGAAASWPASAVHPTHTVYPGSGIEKCGTAEAASIFDACTGLAEGESYSFTFGPAGTWRYHDHNNPGRTGSVEVK